MPDDYRRDDTLPLTGLTKEERELEGSLGSNHTFTDGRRKVL